MPKPVKPHPPAGRLSLGPGHLIVLGLFLLRLGAVLRLTHSSLMLPSQGDMHFYNDWAKDILHGQFSQHLAFYGLPGYAYLLAFLYKVFGENPFVPGFLQAGIEAGVAVLIYQICLQVLDSVASTLFVNTRLVGLFAALGWAFFVPAQAYSAVLMPTTWFVFVFWFVVWRIVRRTGAPGVTECFLLALLIGLTATAVATVLAVVPLIFAALFKADPAVWRNLIARVVVVFAGLALGTSPCWIHNYFTAKDPVLLSAHSGINFWIGNNPEATGYTRFLPGIRDGQAAMTQDSLIQADSNASYTINL